ERDARRWAAAGWHWNRPRRARASARVRSSHGSRCPRPARERTTRLRSRSASRLLSLAGPAVAREPILLALLLTRGLRAPGVLAPLAQPFDDAPFHARLAELLLLVDQRFRRRAMGDLGGLDAVRRGVHREPEVQDHSGRRDL